MVPGKAVLVVGGGVCGIVGVGVRVGAAVGVGVRVGEGVGVRDGARVGVRVETGVVEVEASVAQLSPLALGTQVRLAP